MFCQTKSKKIAPVCSAVQFVSLHNFHKGVDGLSSLTVLFSVKLGEAHVDAHEGTSQALLAPTTELAAKALISALASEHKTPQSL